MTSPARPMNVRCAPSSLCDQCAEDQQFLRTRQVPTAPAKAPTVTAVDVFAGCGGMSIGLQEAARRSGVRLKTSLAVDSDPRIAEIYERNIDGDITVADVGQLFDGGIGSRPTRAESELATRTGPVHILQGGPPCQGHSDLNNHTRRRDPKNALYLSMVRAAEVLRPEVVIIENVAAVQWDSSQVVQTAINTLRALGYSVAGRVLDLWTTGVPQIRRRFVLLASKCPDLDPSAVFDSLTSAWDGHPARTVEWAIEDLLRLNSKSLFDTPSDASHRNTERMAFLFERNLYDLPNDRRPDCHRDGNHSYVSVYGRLHWDRPAQTITTGFGSMGQGRYVHPQKRRTITPHEAARLQTFPDWFDFGVDTPRGVLAKAIGNAVPPLLMVNLGRYVVDALTKNKEAIGQSA